MKKIMVMFAMMVFAMFASPLFALDESPPGIEQENSTNSGKIIYGKTDLRGAAAADVAYVKAVFVHKDTMYSSLLKSDSNKKMKLSGYKQNANSAYATIAVVCYPRGEIGV